MGCAATTTIREALDAVVAECSDDLVYPCDCDDSDGSVCLAHRVLAALTEGDHGAASSAHRPETAQAAPSVSAETALASLEQLVEAAWRVLYLVDIGDGSDSVTEADDALRAALAAVGPGEETA